MRFLIANGHREFACGIDGPSTSAVIDNRNGAQQLSTEGSKACNRNVELRPLLGEACGTPDLERDAVAGFGLVPDGALGQG